MEDIEVRVKGLPGKPVAEVEDYGSYAVSGSCDFCGIEAPDWNTISEHDVLSDNIPWAYQYVAVNASAILEATPDKLIIKTANKRLRRLPSMVACWHCRGRHKQRLRQELKKVGLVFLR